MKINEVTEAVVDRRPGYAKQDNPTTKKYAAVADHLYNYANTLNMKDEEQIKLSTTIGKVATELTLLNTGEGAKSFAEIAKRVGASEKGVKAIIAVGEKIYAQKGDQRQSADAGDDIDNDSNEFGGPDDDEIARQADRAARG
jgi:hypothetical protein